MALHICWMSCSVDRNILRSIETCHHTFTTAPQFEPLANNRVIYYDDWLHRCNTLRYSVEVKHAPRLSPCGATARRCPLCHP